MGLKRSPDFLLFFVTLGLLGLGIVMVASSSSYASMVNLDDPYYYLKRQVIWALIGLAMMFFVMRLDYHVFRRYAGPFFLLTVALLVAVLIVGVTSHGSSRWFRFGPVAFQPSELSKLSCALLVSKIMSGRAARANPFSGFGEAIGAAALLCGLILAQPDLGTAVVVAGIAFLALVAAGAEIRHLTVLGIAGLVLGVAAILIEPYRFRRLIAFINPQADPTGAGWQITQSLLALGSGGLFGVGLGRGHQKLLYVPERHTDFIFAIIGEELGFIGAVAVLVMFFLFSWRGFKVALEAPDSFGSFAAFSITAMVVFQALINMGVVTGCLPVTGITLPLVSYGGSSLVFTLLGVGILLSISRAAAR